VGGTGKQLVYHAPQDPAAHPPPGALAQLDADAAALRATTGAALAELRGAKAALAALQAGAGPSAAELRAGVAGLEEERARLAARLAALRGGGGQGEGRGRLVTAEECAAARARAGKWEVVARKRRRIVREMWGVVEDWVGQAEGVDLAELKVRF
jgi:26S proteasome regulatory subunit (ATPase 3-interacting protein)